MIDPTLGSDFYGLTDPNKTKPVVHDFEVEFDRPLFVATMRFPKLSKFHQKTKSNDGEYIYNNKPVGDEGRPRERFLTAHNLLANSTSLAFFEAFC